MKKIITIGILLILFVLGSSCQKADKCENTKIPYFVMGYHEVGEMRLNELSHYYNLPTIGVYFNNSLKGHYYESNSETYRALSEKHEDYDFNGTVCLGIPPDPLQFIAHDFTKVEVVSNSDYNDQHIAGSALGDLVRFLSVSPYPYIKSRYKNQFEWKTFSEYDLFNTFFPVSIDINYFMISSKNLHPVDNMVSNLTAEDLILLGNGDIIGPIAYLLFETPPTLSKTHTFTVTLTADDGKVFSNSITMMFGRIE